MIVRADAGVNVRAAIDDAAAEIQVRAWVRSNRRGLDVRLLPLNGVPGAPYRVLNHRRKVCWHGHEAFIEALLERLPNIEVQTILTTYRGLADFDERQDDISVEAEELTARQECRCEEADQ